MSATHEHVAGLDPHGGAAEGHNHPTEGTYIRIGVVLAVLTLLEVWVYTVEQLGALIPPILIALAVAKFILVVAFYMHLRFDSRLFTAVFGFALLIAISVFSALLALFSGVVLPPGGIPTLPGGPSAPLH